MRKTFANWLDASMSAAIMSSNWKSNACIAVCIQQTSVASESPTVLYTVISAFKPCIG